MGSKTEIQNTGLQPGVPMDLKRKDNDDSDEDREIGEWQSFTYRDLSESEGSAGRCENYPLVPAEVLEGIDDAVEGRTMDGDDLDDALLF